MSQFAEALHMYSAYSGEVDHAGQNAQHITTAEKSKPSTLVITWGISSMALLLNLDAPLSFSCLLKQRCGLNLNRG
jgi:hypothetical protein